LINGYTIRPASDGVKVRVEGSQSFIAAEGQEVADSSYYRRRIADGDAVRVDKAAPAKSFSAKKEGAE